jgi:hypothetical protein
MRIIGNKKIRTITFDASDELFAQGIKFNEEMKRMPTGNVGFIKKGVYRFRTHQEANRHQDDALAEMMARIAIERAQRG